MAELRLLRIDDLPDLMRLKESAGWNQTEADWRAQLACSPEGCFGIEQDGRIVSSATAMAYPWGVGWIGMVLTLPEFRGRGYAKQLLQTTIEWLQPRTETIGLDATHLGEPLYRNLGFVGDAPIERWRRAAGPLESAEPPQKAPYKGPRQHPPVPIDAVCESDQAWAAGRAGSNAWYFGPCYGVSHDAVTAAAQALLAKRCDAQPVVWDLFPDHPAAKIAAELGFIPFRKLLRMYRGPAYPSPPDLYAISGFEWG